MNSRFARPALPAMVCLCLFLPACGSLSLWPFGGERSGSASPSNATEYQCSGNKRFYVRELDNGNAAWVILPDHQFRLDKAMTTSSGARYTNGTTTLDMSDSEATLTDGSAVSFTGCKTAGKP